MLVARKLQPKLEIMFKLGYVWIYAELIQPSAGLTEKTENISPLLALRGGRVNTRKLASSSLTYK